jgi:signal transduction histidine kinase
MFGTENRDRTSPGPCATSVLPRTKNASATTFGNWQTHRVYINESVHALLDWRRFLSSAVRWYLEGFSERSKIRVELQMPDDIGRLPSDLETAVFRIVQECLTNVHRHAASSTVSVFIARTPDEFRVEVKDEGKGILPTKRAELDLPGKAGVGLRGMRERVRQLGGRLDIQSRQDRSGTIVIASLPLHQSTSTAAS